MHRTRGALKCAIAFFFLSTRFATSLTFVFRSFSSASRIKREFSGLSADVDPLSSNNLALLLDASTVGTRAEDLSPSTGIPAAVLKQALYDSKGTSPRSTRPLPSSRRRRSAPHRQGRLRAASVEFSPRNEESSPRETFQQFPSASVSFRQLTSAGRVFKFALSLAPSCHPSFSGSRRTPNIGA